MSPTVSFTIGTARGTPWSTCVSCCPPALTPPPPAPTATPGRPGVSRSCQTAPPRSPPPPRTLLTLRPSSYLEDTEPGAPWRSFSHRKVNPQTDCTLMVPFLRQDSSVSCQRSVISPSLPTPLTTSHSAAETSPAPPASPCQEGPGRSPLTSCRRDTTTHPGPRPQD